MPRQYGGGGGSGGVTQITAGTGISISPSGGTGNVTVTNASPGPVLINTYEDQLTTTALTSVITASSVSQGIFMVIVYFRVITATTVVTVEVTYTDATGAQTAVLVNAVSEPVGSYSISPLVLAAASASTITVKAQAGTANQVFVSASIDQF